MDDDGGIQFYEQVSKQQHIEDEEHERIQKTDAGQDQAAQHGLEEVRP
jgi:hypothetical protein